MAKLLLRNQQLVYGTLYPRGVYSRWVGFCFLVPAGLGNEQWDVTTILGQDIWLLEAKLILTATTAGAVLGCCWKMATSTVEPTSGGQIAVELEPVVDLTWIGKPYADYVGHDKELSFDMNKLYQGAGRRFCAWVQNNSAAVAIHVIAAFNISEG